MKNFTKLRIALIIALMLGGMASVFAQTLPLSATSSISKQGTNSSGTAAPSTEEPDRVTTGTQVIYLVKPDADLSPTWATEVSTAKDARIATGISATASWAWTVESAIGAFDPSATNNKKHYIMLDITGTPSATERKITVQEQNGTSCTGSVKEIKILIVKKPKATALTLTNSSTCGNDAAGNGHLGVAVPTFKLANEYDSNIPNDPKIIVDATFTFTALGSSTAVPVFTNKKLAVDYSTGNISATDFVNAAGAGYALQSWGTYTLTINKVSDKISRKDMGTDQGYFDATPVSPATSVAASFTVLKPPTTGDIYRLPND